MQRRLLLFRQGIPVSFAEHFEEQSWLSGLASLFQPYVLIVNSCVVGGCVDKQRVLPTSCLGRFLGGPIVVLGPAKLSVRRGWFCGTPPYT